MRIIYFLIILLLQLLGSLQAISQDMSQTIKGRILDEDTKTPLPFATVVILETNPAIGTTTNEEGYFKIEKVPIGRYNLKIAYMGYENKIIREVMVSAGKETVLPISLKESFSTLDEIVIRPSSGKEKPLNNMASISARQLSVEESNRYAGGFNDPARLASSFAGVAGTMSNNGIVIRGNAPKGLLWRIEGVEVPNPSHFSEVVSFGAGGITMLSSQLLANSDFFTGAFPSEYGNALSGVFDIYMRTGNNEKREYAFQVGGIGVEAALEGPFVKGKKSSYLVNYRYSTLGLLTPLLPDDADGTTYQDLSFKCQFPTQKAGTFAFWGLGGNNKSGQEAEEDSTHWLYDQDKQFNETKQAMIATGLSHHYALGSRTYLYSTLAFSGTTMTIDQDEVDEKLLVHPIYKIKNNNWKYTFSSYIQHKFSARHTNKTGIIINQLSYKTLFQQAPAIKKPLENNVDENGANYFLQFYTQSQYALMPNLIINAGIYGHYFLLTNQSNFEPRLGLRWMIDQKQTISMGYGLHSQMEKLNIYLAQRNINNVVTQSNKNLDFMKAHHLVFGYERLIGEHSRLMTEVYYQHLFNVPITSTGSFSIINLDQNWFFNEPLFNKGIGQNIGLDITLERFLHHGYYYLMTCSLMDSKYKSADGVWHNTRFNKGIITNVVIGKEWFVGSKKKNLLNINTRLTFQGGDRLMPVNEPASLAAKKIIEDDSKAFESQKPSAWLVHLTLNYRINKTHHASIWSIQLLNLLGTPEMNGYRYNYKTQTIDAFKETMTIPNLSYKIQF